MKLNPVFVKRDIMGESILVPTAQAAGEYNGLITLNQVGGFIYDLLQETADVDLLAQRVAAEFEVDLETARRDTEAFLQKLQNHGVILN